MLCVLCRKGIGYVDAHLLAAAALTKGRGSGRATGCAFRDSSNH
jgi:hypothetical protein